MAATPGFTVGSAATLAGSFTRHAAHHIEIVKEALLFDDAGRLEIAARSLSRLCSTAAARRMKALAARLEQCGVGDVKTAIGLVLALEWEVATLRRHPQAA